MLNKLILLPSMIFIILLLCSCESFEAQKTFARRILDNPDSAISIYKNSEFYNDSINNKEWRVEYVLKDNLLFDNYIQFLKKSKTLKNNNKMFQIVYKYHQKEYFVLFTFEKVNGKWYLVTMNSGNTFPFTPIM